MKLLSKSLLALALSSLCVTACSHQPPPADPVTTMGLTETALGHDLIEHAAETSNSWIGAGSAIHFVPVWEKGEGSVSKTDVLIYTVSEVGAPASYMVVVPTRCRCVLVQPRAYETWLYNHVSHRGQTLEISKERLLAFMLLHEAGHIAHGNAGEFDGNGTGSINTESTAEKQREQAADSYAVEKLKGAMARTKDSQAWMSAQFATVDLSNLAFEMQQVRQERFFGAELLHSPEAFYDIGYTHPNFELRLLTVNDTISNTPTSRELLQSFLAKRAPQSSVLFRRQP